MDLREIRNVHPHPFFCSVLPSGMARPLFQLGFYARRLVQAPSTHRSFLLTRPCLLQRQFRYFDTFSNKPLKPTPTPPASPPPPSSEPTLAQQRKSDWAIIKRLLENVWPRGDWKTRGTVLFSFGLLVGSKVCQYFNHMETKIVISLGEISF